MTKTSKPRGPDKRGHAIQVNLTDEEAEKFKRFILEESVRRDEQLSASELIREAIFKCYLAEKKR